MKGRVRCPRFIGRTDELASLRERCSEARLGRGSLVFVGGDAGIGKTRLIDEVLTQARPLGMHAVKSFCLQHARSALGPAADMVRALHGADDSVLTVARNVRRILARLVPELATEDVPDVDAQGARSQYAAITEMLRRFGERHPCVLVIEDAHWADISTIEFVKYFAARIAETHVLLVVVSRSAGESSRHLWPTVSEMRRLPSVFEIHLGPLSAAEMHGLLNASLGKETLGPDRLRTICDLAGGNPLFAEELLAAALGAWPDRQPLPASIREIFLERLLELDAEDREILVEASVIGRRFDPHFLSHLSKRPLDRILLALRRARAQNLVTEVADEGVVFCHALVRETLYESILAAEARAVHRRIAGELERLTDTPHRIAALAYHAWSAGDAPLALAYNELAGDEAMAQLATNQAAVFYERALGCAVDVRRRASLHRKLGDAYSAGGWSTSAIAMYERAYEYAHRTDDRESAVALCLALGRECASSAHADAALNWRNAALQAVAHQPAGALAFSAYADAALAYAWRGEIENTRRLVAAAQACEGTFTPWARQDLLEAQCTLEALTGQARIAIARFAQAGADALAGGSGVLAVRSYHGFGLMAKAAGRYALWRQGADEVLQVTDEVLYPLYRPFALVAAGHCYAQHGELVAARRFLAQAEEAAAGIEHARLRASMVQLALTLAMALGDDLLAERYADERIIDTALASCEPWWIGSIAAVFADRFGRLGRERDARLLIERALERLSTLTFTPEFAVVAGAYGGPADVQRARELLANWAATAHGECGRAFRDLFDARVARRNGDGKAAVLGKRAAQRFEQLGMPLWTAEAYEAAGERAAAAKTYARIGGAAITPESSRRSADLSSAPLTRREREVVTFVTDSRSNREIAHELQISERTVESHIRAILSKVGGRSRHDIIRRAALPWPPSDR